VARAGQGCSSEYPCSGRHSLAVDLGYTLAIPCSRFKQPALVDHLCTYKQLQASRCCDLMKQKLA
jgi:hypothetical protein